MRLTTKGRYAVAAMLDVALHCCSLPAEAQPVSLADIAQRQDISLSYLEQLFSKLKKHGLVESVRGPGGGYKLQRDAQSIYITHIIEAVNETIDATNCGGEGDCQQGEMCLTHNLWSDLSDHIFEFLNGISLASLIERDDIIKIAMRQEREQISEQKNTQRISATQL